MRESQKYKKKKKNPIMVGRANGLSLMFSLFYFSSCVSPVSWRVGAMSEINKKY